jgi:hypothetical protein
MKNLYILLLAFGFHTLLAQDGEFHLDQVYKINKNGTIDLSASDAKVFITGSLRPDAHVKIDRKVTMKGWYSSEEKFNVEVEPDNGGLRIREHQENYQTGVISYYKEEYTIEIAAPEGVSLTVKGDDGDYYIKNVNGAISLSLDDADVELTDCKGDRFTFRLDDGDIRMDKGRGSIEVDADDADVEIYHAQFTSIYADIDDGDLIIETSLANNGDYQFKSQDGSIALNITGGGGDFDIRHDDGHISTHGDFKIIHESEDKTRITLGKGTAKVTVRADDAHVKLSSSL